MRVLFWDVRVGGGRRLPLIERIDADVVLLLAVSKASARNWSQRWEGRWHTLAGLDLVTSPQQRPHGAMIASRWPLHDAAVVDELDRPERGLVVTTDHPDGPLTLVSWGTPNAAGNGRAVKNAAYAHMGELLPTLATPLVVGVDTNSWYDPPSDNAIVEDPKVAEEHDFVDRDPTHGLVDVHRALVDADPHRARLLADLRPHGPLATTFVRRPHGQPRGLARSVDDGRPWGMDRMDRLYVSRDITPLACEHLWHEAIDAGGDHAAVIADVQLPGQA